MSKADARKLTRDAQEALRKRVVIAVEKKGVKQLDAVEIFDVSLSAITKWVKVYRRYGLAGLSKKRQGRPKESGKLKGWQASMIVRSIKDKCPEQLKMPWALWTREAVQQLIKDKFDIEVSISSVSRLLKKWGFTPQKPIYRAYERNPQIIDHWMKTEYPIIHNSAKEEGAEIHWGDEMGIRSEDQVGRSFGKRGHTPVVKSASGKRFRCNMISSIANNGHCRFMIFEESFTIDVFLKFLRKLIYKTDRKIYLIIDNHRVHHAKKVTKWTEKHSEKIQLFFLPPYAPELNPDELLNQDVKANATKKNRPKSVKELKMRLRSYLNSIQKKPQKVKNYFKAKQVSYIDSREAA